MLRQSAPFACSPARSGGSTLVSIDRLYEEAAGRDGFVRFALEILHPLGERLGWDVRPSEDAIVPMLRDEVLVALGEFGDKQVTAEARRRFEMSLQNPQAVSPAVRRTALSIVARESDKETFDRLIALLHATQDPLEKLDISWRWSVSWIRWVRNGCSNLRSGATRRQERRLSLILNSNMIYPNTSRQNTTQ
jgi:hypothetical protein